MPDKDTIVLIAEEFGNALTPLADAFKTDAALIDFFKKLGWDVTPAVGAIKSIKAPVELASSLAKNNTATSISEVPQLINAITSAFSKIKALGGLPAAMASELPLQLLEFLITEYLLTRKPIVGGVLRTVGIIVTDKISAAPPRLEYYRKRFDFKNFLSWLSNPAVYYTDVLKWGTSQFRGEEFQSAIQDLTTAWGFINNLQALPINVINNLKNELGNVPTIPDVIKIFFIQKPGLEAGIQIFINPPGIAPPSFPGFTIIPFATGAIEETSNFNNKLKIKLNSNTSLNNDLGIIIQPTKGVVIKNGLNASPVPFNGITTLLTTLLNPSPVLLFGKKDATRIEIGNIENVSKAELDKNGNPSISTEFFFKQGKIVVKPDGEADGFIGSLLPADGLQVNFDLSVGVSSTQGLYFGGSGGLEIQIPTHIKLGPLEISAATIAIKPNASEIPLEIGATFKGDLSILKATVENIGLKASFTFPDNKAGNLGPVNISLGFKPPKGVGLSIDVGIIRGGGYLSLDFQKGEYAGALELTFAEFLSLKAVGIINTKMPDGSNGFSMLIIITAEFGAGLQLGFGFVLLGVGGLVGLNRTMVLQELANGVRNGGIESVMFPKNIIENAPKIISDLRQYFPPKANTFLIGPMAKLGWGTPALITVSLGIIIEIPGNIAIVGIVKIALPTEELALVKFQINFIGAIEFDKQRMWFFASLFDSRILFITIEGEVGVLIVWGSDPGFVISIGGFHPAFKAPALPFPSPKRIALNILDTPIAKIKIQGYFAVTSNTVQLGARAELYFGFSAVSVSGILIFDALFQFSPFYFNIHFAVGLSVKVFGLGLFGVGVDAMFEGPTPYHIKGRGSISFLFFDVSFDIETSWGDSENSSLPPITIMVKVREELNKLENWKALLPEGNNLLVTLRKITDAGTDLVLHPVGSLQLSQRYIPLGLTLNKVGTQKTADVKKVSLSVPAGSQLKKLGDLKENFAIAQYQDMKNEEKLSRPSFEKEKSGIGFGVASAVLKTGKGTQRKIRYDVTTIDNYYLSFLPNFIKLFKKRYYALANGLFYNHLLRSNAVAMSAVSQTKKEELNLHLDKINAAATKYAVASTDNNKAVHAAGISFESHAAANEYLQKQAGAPGSLHILPFHELNKAV